MNNSEIDTLKIVDRRINGDRRRPSAFQNSDFEKGTFLERRNGKARRSLVKRRKVERWYC